MEYERKQCANHHAQSCIEHGDAPALAACVGFGCRYPVELIPVRVLNSSNKGTMADVAAAIYWAVESAISALRAKDVIEIK